MLMRRAESLTTRWASLCRHYIATPKNSQAAAQPALTENEEYTEVAQYPEILDLALNARKERDAQSWHEEIQNALTVEEKMIKINMPRYYGFKVVELHDARLPYNCLPAIQHYTRTLYESLSADVKGDDKVSSYVEAIKGDVQDAVELAHDYFR